MDQAERRLYERFPARFPAKFKDARADFGQEVVLRDASASGINILTRERMFFNDKIAIEIELPDNESPLVLNGRIVWSKPANASAWESGMQFEQVNFMKMQRLYKSAASS